MSYKKGEVKLVSNLRINNEENIGNVTNRDDTCLICDLFVLSVLTPISRDELSVIISVLSQSDSEGWEGCNENSERGRPLGVLGVPSGFN